MAVHTPTPWGLNKYNELVDAAGENIRAKGFALTNTAEAHSNTAFIHRAVNAHDDLVKALGTLRSAVELLEHIGRTPDYGQDQNSREELRATIEDAREALAKAAS